MGRALQPAPTAPRRPGIQGDGAGNANTTRTLAAQALTDWIASDPTDSGDGNVLVIGDVTVYAMETPIRTLLAGADAQAGTADDMTRLTEDYTCGFPADLAGRIDFDQVDLEVTGGLQVSVSAVEFFRTEADSSGQRRLERPCAAMTDHARHPRPLRWAGRPLRAAGVVAGQPDVPALPNLVPEHALRS